MRNRWAKAIDSPCRGRKTGPLITTRIIPPSRRLYPALRPDSGAPGAKRSGKSLLRKWKLEEDPPSPHPLPQERENLRCVATFSCFPVWRRLMMTPLSEGITMSTELHSAPRRLAALLILLGLLAGVGPVRSDEELLSLVASQESSQGFPRGEQLIQFGGALDAFGNARTCCRGSNALALKSDGCQCRSCP